MRVVLPFEREWWLSASSYVWYTILELKMFVMCQNVIKVKAILKCGCPVLSWRVC